MALRLPRPSFKVWLFLLLLGLGGLLTFLDQRDALIPGPIPRDEAGEPDYYLEGVRLTRFDTQGQAYQRLVTPRLVHTPNNDVTQLTTPDMRLISEAGRTWQANSDSGTLGPGGNPLTLSGNTRLRAPAENWQLDTEVLHYDAEQGHAWSNTPSVFRQPPQEMRAKRFDAWIQEDRLRLTDNVRGYHPPETTPSTDEEPPS